MISHFLDKIRSGSEHQLKVKQSSRLMIMATVGHKMKMSLHYLYRTVKANRICYHQIHRYQYIQQEQVYNTLQCKIQWFALAFISNIHLLSEKKRMCSLGFISKKCQFFNLNINQLKFKLRMRIKWFEVNRFYFVGNYCYFDKKK